MPYGILTVLAIGNVHAIFGVLTVLDPGISVSLILALHRTVAVASCEQQHEFLLLRGSRFDLPSHSSVVVIAPHDMTIRNDCRVVHVVVVATINLIAGVSRLHVH